MTCLRENNEEQEVLVLRLNLVEDWLFYQKWDRGSKAEKMDAIYKMRLDGKTMPKDQPNYSRYGAAIGEQYEGDWFYVGEIIEDVDEFYNLRRMSLDGKTDERIAENITDFLVEKEGIYCGKEENGKLFFSATTDAQSEWLSIALIPMEPVCRSYMSIRSKGVRKQRHRTKTLSCCFSLCINLNVFNSFN